MTHLISLEAAKKQLRVTETDYTHDEDIDMKIIQASQIVMDMIDPDKVDSWEVNTSPVTYDVPAAAQAATLIVLSAMFSERETGISEDLMTSVRNILGVNLYRRPGMA